MIDWLNFTGVHTCTLKTLDVPPQIQSFLSSYEGRISLSAVSEDGKVTSDAVSIPFIPPAYLHTKELYLTTAEPLAYIELSATPSSVSYVMVKVR